MGLFSTHWSGTYEGHTIVEAVGVQGAFTETATVSVDGQAVAMTKVK
jgi:hypothetical protein